MLHISEVLRWKYALKQIVAGVFLYRITIECGGENAPRHRDTVLAMKDGQVFLIAWSSLILHHALAGSKARSPWFIPEAFWPITTHSMSALHLVQHAHCILMNTTQSSVWSLQNHCIQVLVWAGLSFPHSGSSTLLEWILLLARQESRERTCWVLYV